jgi:hypothetical protein
VGFLIGFESIDYTLLVVDIQEEIQTDKKLEIVGVNEELNIFEKG